MNTEARRFRHVGWKSGSFVLAALLVVVAVLLLAARAQWWFASVRTYTVRLPDEGLSGLRGGSSVEMLGAEAGWVRSVRIEDDGSLQASVAVREDFARFVAADSNCSIRKRTLDLGGDAYLQITRGKGVPLPSGSQLFCKTERDVMQSLSELASQLATDLPSALAEARATAHEYAALARSLRDPDGPLQQLVGRLNQLAQQAGEGQGAAARLLNDPAWAAEIDASLHGLRSALEHADATAEKIGAVTQSTGDRASALLDQLGNGDHGVPAALADLRALLAELRPIVADLGKAVATLPEITATARNEVRGLPGVVERSQVLLGELEKVVLAAQRHWLLRGYVEPSPATRRVGGEGLGEAK